MSTTRAILEFPDATLEALLEATRRLGEHDRAQLVRRVTAASTVSVDDDLILVTTGATVAMQITLPLAEEAQRKLFTVKKIDAGVGTVQVQGQGGQTIDGGVILLAAQYDRVTVLPDPDGLTWWRVD